MANLNRVLLIGRLTRDPEMRYTPSGTAVAEFGLAVNSYRKGQDGNRIEETTFVDLTGFGRTAELASQYLSKGRQVFIEGHLRLEQWTSKEGQKRSKLSVVIDNLQFIDSRGEGGQGGGGGNYNRQGSNRGQSAPRDDFAESQAEPRSSVPGRESSGHNEGFSDDQFGGRGGDAPPTGDEIPF